MDNTYYNSVTNKNIFLKGVYESKKANKTSIQSIVDSLKDEKDVLTKTEKVLKYLIDKLVKQDLSNMDNLITYGLKTVFPYKDIKFQSDIEERGKKILINLNTVDSGNTLDPDSKSSVHVIESFLLRLMCIIKLKRAKLLLLDETFSAVHVDNIEALGELINSLTKKLGIDILLVTHDNEISQYVAHSYKLTQVNSAIEVQKLK